jgi:predicted dehydrogenase
MASPLLCERDLGQAASGVTGMILVAGSDSTGQRRLETLRTLGQRQLSLCRAPSDTQVYHDVGLPVHRRLETALADRPLAVVVTGPPAQHLETALAVARAGAHLFVESPLSHSIEGVVQLRTEVALRGLVAQVGFPYRHHPTLLRIKGWLDAGAIGRPVSAQVHWSESLRKLCHPIDYLRLLLGEPEWVAADVGGVEGTGAVTLRFLSGVLARIYMDHGRPRPHELQLEGREGRITWNGEDGVARLCEGAGRVRCASPEPGFDHCVPYLDEMRVFLRCLHGQASPCCTLEDGQRALEIAVAAEEALASGRRVGV